MAAQHETLNEFSPENNCITSYLERASLYFTANEVAGEMQVAVLLSSIGLSTYALLSDLFVPEKPSSKAFKKISEVLENHYNPQHVIIAEQFHFIRGIRLQASQLQNMMLCFLNWLLTVISRQCSTTLSVIDLFVEYIIN